MQDSPTPNPAGRLSRVLVQLHHVENNEAQEGGRPDEGQDDAGRHLVAVAAEHVADLVPVHVGVAVPAYDPDGRGGAAGREQEPDHERVQDTQDQPDALPRADGGEAQGYGGVCAADGVRYYEVAASTRK